MIKIKDNGDLHLTGVDEVGAEVDALLEAAELKAAFAEAGMVLVPRGLAEEMRSHFLSESSEVKSLASPHAEWLVSIAQQFADVLKEAE